MKITTVLRFMHWWGPFFGSRTRVMSFAPDLLWIEVAMKSHWWNRNYHGTHFGGSLFAMTDPFFALMLIHHFGRGYEVWDKAATIRFKKPGRGTVRARFELSATQLAELRQQLQSTDKIAPQFQVQILDKAGDVVAQIDKTVTIRKRH